MGSRIAQAVRIKRIANVFNEALKLGKMEDAAKFADDLAKEAEDFAEWAENESFERESKPEPRSHKPKESEKMF